MTKHTRLTTVARLVLLVAVVAGWMASTANGQTGLAARGSSELPLGLTSTDRGVICNPERDACYDRFGPSIGLTEAFLGPESAARLTAALREKRPDDSGEVFSPADGVECTVKIGPCRIDGKKHVELTRILYGSVPRRTDVGPPRPLLGTEWKWRITRFNDDTVVEPPEPGDYTLRLDPGGTVQVRADCNLAGGQYRAASGKLHIEITHSTMAACLPDSLDRVYLRDLSRAVTYMIKSGRLYLDLEMHTGTMEFVP